MTFAKLGLTLAVGASLLVGSLATVETASAGPYGYGYGHHRFMRHYHRPYNYGSHRDARRQTRSGGPVGGLNGRN